MKHKGDRIRIICAHDSLGVQGHILIISFGAWCTPKDRVSILFSSLLPHRVHTWIALDETPSGKGLELNNKEIGGILKSTEYGHRLVWKEVGLDFSDL